MWIFKIIGFETQQKVEFIPQSAGFAPAKCGDCPIKIWPQSAKTQSAGPQSAGFMCKYKFSIITEKILKSIFSAH